MAGNWWDAASQNMPSANYGQPQVDPLNSQQHAQQMNPGGYQSFRAIPNDPNNMNRDQNSGWFNQRPMPFQPNWQTGGGDPGNGSMAGPGYSAMGYRSYGNNAGMYPPAMNGPQQSGGQALMNMPMPGQPGYDPATTARATAQFYSTPTLSNGQYGFMTPGANGQGPQFQPGQGQNQLLQMLQQIMQQRGGGQQPQGPQFPGRPTPWNDITMQQGPGGQYSYLGGQQGQLGNPNARNGGSPFGQVGYSGGPTDPGMMQRQSPQQQPSGMSQQMPAFLQQLMQQRMMQQQMQQVQPQQGSWNGVPGSGYDYSPMSAARLAAVHNPNTQYEQLAGGGMNTGMGMPQGQQGNQFLQMLMQMQQRPQGY